MFPSVRELVNEASVIARCWCGGTLKNLINCKEWWAPFINLILPRSCPGKTRLYPSFWLRIWKPPGLSNPFRGFEIPIFNPEVHEYSSRGVAMLRVAPGSWDPLKGLASCRLKKQFSFCVLGWQAVQARACSRPHIVHVWEGLCQHEWTFLRQGAGDIILGV